MRALLQDLRYGARLLLKRPGFTATVVLTLALGIGANTAVFSVVNAVILRPLPYADPARLVMIWETMPGNDQRNVAPGNLSDWRTQSQAFAQIAGYANTNLNLSGDGEPEKLTGVAVSTNFFATLGVSAERGRTFLPEDVQRQDGRVLLLSHGLWQRRFGADPRIIGRSLTLDEKSYTIIGIMPATFSLPARAELWVLGDRGEAVTPALAAQFPKANVTTQRDIHIAYAIGRLKPQVTLAQAQAELRTIADRLAQAYPQTNAGLGVNVIPLQEQIVGGVGPTLFILLGAVAFVLLIACTNVANLLLARATQRERELAIRLALGAGRGRLIRQMLTESLLLSLVGGLLGLLAAMWGVDLFIGLSPGDIPRLDEVGLDVRLLAFTVLISLATGIAFGLLPALQATRLDPQHALKEGGTKASESRRRRRVRNLLVMAEIALAQVLLVGAGLLIVSFVRLQAVDPGFNPKHLLTARVALSGTNYADNAQKTRFYDQVLARTQALPGVRAAGLVMSLPLSGATINRGFTIEGRPAPKADENISIDYQLISPGYFSAMEIPLLGGRPFTATDGARAPRVVIINELMARKYFSGANPLGQRLAFGDASKPESWRTIVGIVANNRDESIDAPPFPAAYVPYQQNLEPWARMAIVLRTGADAAGLAGALRKEIAAVDPNLPVSNVETMEQLLADGVTRPRFVMLLLGVLAVVALTLAAIGIYGLISYSITERTHEIGIRLALGAQRRDIFKQIIGQGLVLALGGVGVGLAAAFALTRVLAKLLFGVTASDPLTFVGVALLLTMIALVASYVPARRATRVDPMLALRYE